MPHEFVVGAFEPGDDDMGDFMLDVWLPFARDDCNWEDNEAPAVGTRPDIEMWTHRGTTASPLPPYFCARTHASHMQIFTGNGLDTGEEIYDQPANPGNAPVNTSFTPSAAVDMRCLFLNSAVGPYQGYWLFADTTGEYIHCVLKVNSREYRHFHVGLLRQIDGGVDLHADSFYITGHYWNLLDPDAFVWDTIGPTDGEHEPYSSAHAPPHRSRSGSSAQGAFGRAQLGTIPCAHYYMPGLNPISLVSATVNAGGTGHAVDDIITLSLNDGTGPTTPTLRVTAVTGGVIDTVSVEDAGDLTNRIYPNTAVTQASTTGSGVDATFDLTQEGHSWYIAQASDGLECIGSPVNKSEGNPGTAVGDVNEVVNIGCAQTNYYDKGFGTALFAADANFTANANILVPIYISAAFDFQSDIRQGVVAQVPDVFRINMRDYTPEQTITVGGEDYKVFPVMNMDSVNVVDGEGYSGWEGLAYRVETGAVV